MLCNHVEANALDGWVLFFCVWVLVVEKGGVEMVVFFLVFWLIEKHAFMLVEKARKTTGERDDQLIDIIRQYHIYIYIYIYVIYDLYINIYTVYVYIQYNIKQCMSEIRWRRSLTPCWLLQHSQMEVVQTKSSSKKIPTDPLKLFFFVFLLLVHFHVLPNLLKWLMTKEISENLFL